ncbi:MAG: hypothetical protein KDJ80_12295 [Nitratireductor sp.]|nr:hypothetical protein [Nitratireductor sp.]
MAREAATVVSVENSKGYFRLDPYAIPDRIRFTRNAVEYTLDRTGVSVRMILAKSGLPLSFALPARSFKGIAARCVEHADGSHTVSLELHHHDPALCIPVLVAGDLNDIAADWHSWSRLMRLPMLIIDERGLAQTIRNELGAIRVETPIARRRRITLLRHRPWFLRRRKAGTVGEVTKITAAEIISRH